VFLEILYLYIEHYLHSISKSGHFYLDDFYFVPVFHEIFDEIQNVGKKYFAKVNIEPKNYNISPNRKNNSNWTMSKYGLLPVRDFAKNNEILRK
jgi:hypothetical protein